MEQTRSTDETTIAYERFGAGLPIVVVGGALCDRTANRPLAEELGRRDLCGVTYDRRGRGASGAADGYAIEHEVDDLAALIDAVGAPAALYGHSSGAALALRAAAAGLPLTHLVLHDAPFNRDEPDARAVSQAYRRELEALIGEGRHDDATQLFLRTVGAPDDAIARMRTEPWWRAMVALGPTLLHDSEVMGDGHGGTVPSELLTSVAVPTLVVYGGDNPPWMLDIAKQLADGIADATLEILKGEDHVVASDVLAPILHGFLTSRTASAGSPRG